MKISDHARKYGEFTEYGIDKNVILRRGQAEITTMMDKVGETLDNAVKALSEGDMAAADKVVKRLNRRWTIWRPS